MLGTIACVALLLPAVTDVPTIELRSDDLVVTESCRIHVPPDTVIEDNNRNGVIQVAAAGIEIQFTGGTLRGARESAHPDEYEGTAIRIRGQSGVTIRNARVSGFRCGIWATDADGLHLDNINVIDNRRAHLKSTPTAEDSGDWLWPHANDDNEWLNNYGAAFYIEDSQRVTVHDCRVRDTQNGLVLDRVRASKVYDNDFSFLSGWGIAMWRASRNVISRNALDFCVRGYSHGVYNRGQDSAGLLVFEQCCENVFAENSATHCGDGVFGFAGREALGEKPPESGTFDCTRRGNNDNLLVRNDFSYAPAHGIEMTFSFGNRMIANRLVGNAICGVWGGYSQDTLIAGNVLADNGELGYGLERGGVNIEHGRGNRIVRNEFRKNRCGVHLWWDAEGDFASKPWGKANGTDSKDNLVAANTFDGDKLAFHLRGPSEVVIAQNDLRNVATAITADAEVTIIRDLAEPVPDVAMPGHSVFGEKRPLGTRRHLRGRENIIMTEWGPWDHQAPLVRLVAVGAAQRTYELRRMPTKPNARLQADGVTVQLSPVGADQDTWHCVLAAQRPGAYPFALTIEAGDFTQNVSDTIVAAEWNATFFTWPKETDPREHLAEWRELADGSGAHTVKTDRILLKYGRGGPSDQNLSDELTAAKIGGDHFGMIARTRLPLTPGTWKFSTTSDDGVRVMVNGKPIIENWTWHGPTRNEGTLEQQCAATVEIIVEHFEIDGYATLELSIAKQSP